MLRIDRKQARTRSRSDFHDDIAADDERLFVCQRDICAALKGSQSRRQTGGTRNGVEDRIDFELRNIVSCPRPDEHPLHGVRNPSGGSGRCNGPLHLVSRCGTDSTQGSCAKANGLRGCGGNIRVADETDYLKAVRVGADDVEGLRPNGTGRAEN